MVISGKAGWSNRGKSSADPRTQELQTIKSKLHQDVINKIDLEILVKFDSDTARMEVAKLVWELVNELTFPLGGSEKRLLVDEVVDETFGLGPLEPLLQDRSIDDILVNNFSAVYIERNGKLERTNVRFKDDTHLRHIINRIVARVGRRIDEASPMVDARLPDGSRINAIIPPLALDGCVLCVRKFKEMPLTSETLLKLGSISPEIMFLLKVAVRIRLNLLVSGGTGSGKTTFLNVLSAFIPEDERIVTIEDAAELQLQQPHVVRLETRPSNMEGKGRIDQTDLLRNSLRMRPDRIIIGEVRGPEALDMLQAMNTGHDGSIATIHSNSPRDAISRVETMVLMSNANMLPQVIGRQVSSALNLIVHIRRYPDGVRRFESLWEIVGMEGDIITMQEIAAYVQRGTTSDGKCIGSFELRPVKPRFLSKAKAMGITIPETLEGLLSKI